MKKFVVLLVVLTITLGTVLAVRLRQQAREAEAPPGSSGIVEGTRVMVASRLASRIAKVHVRDGDPVEPGTLLAELDCSEPDALVAEATARVEAGRAQVEAANAQAAAAGAQAQAAAGQAKAAEGQARSTAATIGSVKVQGENARRQEARARRLEVDGAAAAQAREYAETATQDLQARLAATSAASGAAKEAARAAGRQADAAARQAEAAAVNVEAARKLLAAGEAALERAKVAQGECKVVSPVKGVVTVRAREPGEVVLPGSTLFELTDWSETRITFYVVNRDLGRVAVGASVKVVADPYPNETFPGKVRRVSDEAEFTPRTIQTRSDRDRLVYSVEAIVDNPGLKLRAGMPVEVEVAQP